MFRRPFHLLPKRLFRVCRGGAAAPAGRARIQKRPRPEPGARRLSKKHCPGCRDRAAGEFEGARPASNRIGERPKKPYFGFFGFRILPYGKIRARKAQAKKSAKDFFDKLSAPGRSRGRERKAVDYCDKT